MFAWMQQEEASRLSSVEDAAELRTPELAALGPQP